jgi:hypothetical protein
MTVWVVTKLSLKRRAHEIVREVVSVCASPKVARDEIRKKIGVYGVDSGYRVDRKVVKGW